MKTFIILAFLILGTSAWAGPSTSGGGIGVLCEYGDGQKLQLLDLFEAQLTGQRLVSSTGSFVEDYAVGLQRLRQLGDDPRPVSSDDKRNMLDMFTRYTEFTDRYLSPSDDIGVSVPLPPNCHLVQIAIYQDRDNKLVLNKTLWNQLDSLNQAALVMHEAIYKMQRIAFYNNSFQSRRLVREVFLKDGPSMKGVYDGLEKGKGLLCFAGDSGTNSSISFVWQGDQIHLLTFAGEARLVKTTLKVPVPLDDIKLQAAAINDEDIGYKVISASKGFEIKTAFFESEMPISHITWSQSVLDGEFFRVGMNVNGRILSYPVSSCFKFQ